MAEISVYSFRDYREFLDAVYTSRKAAQPALTLGAFSRRLGFGTDNYARLILDGKRNLTVEHIHSVASALDLTSNESEYFEALVLWAQCGSEQSRKYYQRRVQKLRSTKPKRSARILAGQLLTEWYFPAVLLLADGVPVEGAVEKIRKNLPLERGRIEEVFDQLVRLGLIKKIDGICRLDFTHHIFHDMRSSGAKHKQFLKNQLGLSQTMLEKRYEKGAKFYSHTFTIRESDFAVCENRLRELMEELTALSDETSGEHVVQLNMQLFRIGGS